MAYESYLAKADERAARDLAATESPFQIEIRFLGGLTQQQQNAFKKAADRWTKVIVGDLPAVHVDGELIDDLLILAQGVAIDGPGRILGQAGPTHLRPATAGASAYIPAKGIMSFDTADLKAMQQQGTLNDVITHEMGHVLGFGTIWIPKKLLKGSGTTNPTFSGKNAMNAYKDLRHLAGRAEVPVENMGGPGTRDSHWRESVFGNELMSGYIAAADNPLSRLTVASLRDLGYAVNLDAAEPYALPDLLMLAEAGAVATRARPIDEAVVLPYIPVTLPSESLR
jgi:hypothetical protein